MGEHQKVRVSSEHEHVVFHKVRVSSEHEHLSIEYERVSSTKVRVPSEYRAPTYIIFKVKLINNYFYLQNFHNPWIR